MYVEIHPHRAACWNIHNSSLQRKHLSQQGSRWGGGSVGGLCQVLRRGQAVNRSVLLHNGATCVVSEKINTSQGSLLLSCGEFLHLPTGAFKDVHFQLWWIVAASCRHKVSKNLEYNTNYKSQLNNNMWAACLKDASIVRSAEFHPSIHFPGCAGFDIP